MAQVRIWEWGLMRLDGNGNELGLLNHTCDTRKVARQYRQNYLSLFDNAPMYVPKSKGGHGHTIKVGRVEVTHRWLG